MKTLELDTPVLLIDSDALDRNIARMKDMAAAAGVTYRPHAKTHKSAVIARKQIDAGAVGVCCAKLGEAEVLASEGIDNILITTPVVGATVMALNQDEPSYTPSEKPLSASVLNWNRAAFVGVASFHSEMVAGSAT